jgi:nicotinamidase-related amidase
MADTDKVLNDLRKALPVVFQEVALQPKKTGLIIVDEVNGFCTVGAGNLAPAAPDAQIAQMVGETERLAQLYAAQKWPILAFLDTHTPGKPEPPYPPHCELGTGEENLVPALAFLENDPNATLVRKDCINGYIGAERGDGTNRLLDWIRDNGIEQVVVTGICTDICDLDFVVTLLSARNSDKVDTGRLKDIVVYEPGTSTYDLPESVQKKLGLPESAIHPQKITHHAALYFMQARGAVLANRLNLA